MRPKSEDALVVFSGGQDSTTCLVWAMRHFRRVVALTFRYGQKHAAEVECAERIARQLGVEWMVHDAQFIGTLSRNALTDTSVVMDERKPEQSCPNTFVPGRNLFFLSIAGVIAQARSIRHIVTGVGQTDFSGYPDCRDNFIRSLNVTLNLALESSLVIHAPLMWMDKADTWRLADDLGAFSLVRHQTLTCYNNVVGEGCGHCPACQLRREGLETFLRERPQCADL